MEAPKDIMTREDIRQLVDDFYEEVRKDELLAPVFDQRIGNRWPEHLEKMYAFWQTVLLNEHTYLGSPFPPHARLPISGEHFDRWLKLFQATADRLFKGEKADEAKWRAGKMAELFLSKIDYYKTNGFKSIL